MNASNSISINPATCIVDAVDYVHEKNDDTEVDNYVNEIINSTISNINSGRIVKKWSFSLDRYPDLSLFKKKALIRLLRDVVMRKVEDFMSTDRRSSYPGNLQAEITELVDFARLRIAGNESTLLDDITAIDDQVRESMNNNSTSHASYAWHHVQTSLNAGHERRCLKATDEDAADPATRRSCHQTILSLRRMYRTRTEASLSDEGRESFIICEVRNHLFSAQTYIDLRSKIEQYINLPPSLKESYKVLLRLHFYAKALREVTTTFLEVASHVNEITSRLNTRAGVDENAVAKCDELFEKIHRTIQRTYQSIDTITADDKSVARVKSDPLKTAAGGGGEDTDVDAMRKALAPASDYVYIEDGDEINKNTSITQRSVLSNGSDMSQAYMTLRKALTEASVSTISGSGTEDEGSSSLYMHNTVLPRISAISTDVTRMYREYTYQRNNLISINPSIVKGAESRQIKQHMISSRLKMIDILKYRFSEERTQAFYVLKVWRIVSQLVALWIAQSVYMDKYNQRILGGPTDPAPPSLNLFLMTFLGIDASIQLATLLMLVFAARLRHVNKEHDTYLIDDAFLQAFLIEYFITTLMIAALVLLCDRVIFRNKYFQLRESGSRSIKAYRGMLTGVCVVVNIIPFFIIFK